MIYYLFGWSNGPKKTMTQNMHANSFFVTPYRETSTLNAEQPPDTEGEHPGSLRFVALKGVGCPPTGVVLEETMDESDLTVSGRGLSGLVWLRWLRPGDACAFKWKKTLKPPPNSKRHAPSSSSALQQHQGEQDIYTYILEI